MKLYIKMFKIDFINFWWDFEKNRNNFTQILDKYNIKYIIDEDNPDIIIYTVWGNKHLQDKYKKCKKIFFTGENNRGTGLNKVFYLVNNIDEKADINFSFTFSDNCNNFRFPYWTFHNYDYNLIVDKSGKNPIMRVLKPKPNSKFCCTVFKNAVQNRIEFLNNMSKYKKVDSGGASHNNIGHRVKCKDSFIKEYKFCAAFENSKASGYITEKIFDAYRCNCIPIFGGTTDITHDFNKETFINANDFDSMDDLIEYVKKVDSDENLYMSYMNKPIFSNYWLEKFNDDCPDNFFKKVAELITGKKIN